MTKQELMDSVEDLVVEHTDFYEKKVKVLEEQVEVLEDGLDYYRRFGAIIEMFEDVNESIFDPITNAADQIALKEFLVKMSER